MPQPKTIVPNPKGTAVCPSCYAVYERKRWFELEQRSRELRADPRAEHKTCPACVRAKADMPEGILLVSGKFVAEHHDDVLQTILSVAKRERARDTLCRILDVRSSPEGITVKTANEHLVRTLGHALHSAFHGHLTYVFSHDDRMTRVHLHRDEPSRAAQKKQGRRGRS